MQSSPIAQKTKAFFIQRMLGGDVGGSWVRKYTNTRLMTLSQSTCFVTWEGGLFKRIAAEIHKYNIIEEYSNAL